MVFYEYANVLIFSINKKVENKALKLVLLIGLSPYILIKGLICLFYDYSVGRIIQRLRINRDNEREFKYELGFVAIAKNEGEYIREWIAYHDLICDGKAKFYVYDNDSEDNLAETISDYISRGIVQYIYYPGKSKQCDAYEDAIRNYRQECRYMAVIDIDEFIETFPDNKNAIEIISSIFNKNPNAVGVGINWMLFGSSGVVKKADGLVMERFLNRAEDDFWGNEHIKSVINPRFVKKFISCHYPLYKLGSYSIGADGKRQRGWEVSPPQISEIRLNHYFTKSREEYVIKHNRGWADKDGHYDGFERFEKYDRNEVHDESMLKYASIIKERI